MKYKKMNKINILFGIFGILWMSGCSLETDVYENLEAEKFPENQAQLESFTLAPYEKLSNILLVLNLLDHCANIAV